MLGRHLLGLYEKAIDASTPWAEKLRKAKSLGYDYIEMSVDESDERLGRLWWTADDIRNLRRVIDAEGLPIYTLCLSVHRRFPMGSEDPQTAEKARDILKRAVELAAAIGVRTIQLCGYDVYDEASTESTRGRFEEGMHYAASVAEKYQVMLGMEIMDTQFMNSITKFLKYEERICSPWYKAYPDIGNLSAWPENDVEKELTEGIKSIAAIHIKDTRAITANFPGQFRDVPYGAGCVDFTRFFTLMETLSYAGPYTMEMWHRDGQDDMKMVSEAKAWIDATYAQVCGD